MKHRAIIKQVTLHVVLVLAICGMVAKFLHGTIDLFFAQDDFYMLNGVINGITPERAMFGTLEPYARPLSLYWLPLLNYAMFGLEHQGYHVVMLVLLCVTSYTLALYVWSMSKSYYAGLFAAVLYSTSVIHVFTQAWIAAAGDILGILFGLIGLYMVQIKGKLTIPLILFVLALLSKESMIVVLASVIIVEAFNKNWKFVIWGSLCGATYIALTKIVQCVWAESRSHFMFATPQYPDFHRSMIVWQNGLNGFWHGENQPSLIIYALLIAVALAVAGRKTLLGITFMVLGGLLYAFTLTPFSDQIEQLYYAHFIIVGVCMLAGFIVSELRGRSSHAVMIIIMVYLMFSYGNFTAGIIETKASPPLHQSANAYRIYQDISNRQEDYVVVLLSDSIVWESTGRELMYRIYFPDKQFEFVKQWNQAVTNYVNVPVYEDVPR